MAWILRLAWRDSRGSRRRLFLSTAAIAIGIAAITAVRGLGLAMEAGVARQASELLGADLQVESRRPFSSTARALFDSLGGRQARVLGTLSMVLLPASGDTRLCDVRFADGDWPFYGRLRTEPAAAAHTFRRRGEALVDDGVLRQVGAQVGDSIRVGRVTFRIAGRLLGIPGETAVRADLRPPVLVPHRYVQATSLIQYGSRVEYRALFAFDDARPVEALAHTLAKRLRATDPETEVVTARDRQRRLGSTIRNLDRFLGLGGFVALLLGAVGVAGAVHAYVAGKLEIVAVLRSLGATRGQALQVYLLQAGVMGLAGATLGAVAGAAVLRVLPGLVAGFLPGVIDATPDLATVLQGIGVGAAIALLFAAPPLLAVRHASPLLALRAAYEPDLRPGDRLLRGLVTVAAGGGAFLLARLLAGRLDHALYFTGGTAAALALLALAARLLRGAVRRFFPRTWPYVWRQGLANLYRPRNQTLLLMVSLGLGTFLVAALYTAHRSVLAHIRDVGGESQPNVVLFDIQADQAGGVADLVRDLGLPVLQQVPVVAMHLVAVKGTPVDSLKHAGWAARREYRSTYRDHLTDSETLVAGAWFARGDTAVVSLEVGIAARLGVGVGDSLTFDVQGVRLPVRVASLRRVEWRRITPNFFCLFPPAALALAPQFQVLVTRAGRPTERAELLRRVVAAYPNVSAIDLDLVLRTVDQVLGRVAALVRFMALFSIGTGLVVLAASVSASRGQRLRECALLRTLGASQRQVAWILLVEYVALGTLAGLTGLVLALAGGWGLARYVFEVTFAPAWDWLLLAAIVVPTATVAVGLGGSRGVTRAPPLQSLRRRL